ncbi:MAG: ABC transporter ATP-binding protein/permease [Bacteroidales bacterium]|jgi:ATP-binding cassette subfamily B protein|nr:ABC transporter ATP-binding protein/permease [Bacteroidales bacterium]
MFKNESLKFLADISRKGKYRLSIAGVLVFFSSVCSLGPYYIIYLFIEKIIHPPFAGDDLFMLVGIAALCIAGQMLFSGIAMTQSHIAAYNILFDLRVALAKKLTRLPLGYYNETSSGTIRKIMMGNIEDIEEFVAHNLVDLISVVFLPVLIFVWLASFNFFLAILSILPVFLGVGLQRLRMKREAEGIHGFFKVKSDMNTTVIDFIRGMPVIKAFNLSVFSFKRYKEGAEKYSRYWIDLNKSSALFFAAYALLTDCGVLVLLPVGGWMYLSGVITLSTFLMFMFMGIGFSRYIKQLTGFGSNLTGIFEGVSELISVMNAKEIVETGTISELNNYDIEFKNVCFSYSDKPVLTDINFMMKQGTVTALVGPSGAGKTTIARLIPRFWDVSSGEITLGGYNIKTIRGDVLMKKVGFVFQDLFMFNDSVFENIRMGDKNVSKDEVIKLAKQARADDFIKNLERGYDTVIGPSGVFLSGGEQQRIAISRALSKKSPIIVLDEATSYSDVENEDKIQKALNVLLKERTVIVIAHRLSTIRNADQILYLENGRIVECGTHKRLIDMGGKYKKMWDLHMDASDWGIRHTGKSETEKIKEVAAC